jgi:hypothetical protein
MGLITAIRQRRRQYRVTVHGMGSGFPVEQFRTIWEAREYANYLASTNTGVACLIHRGDYEEAVARAATGPSTPGDEQSDDSGSPGVREPRRPIPGSSSGSIAINLPD